MQGKDAAYFSTANASIVQNSVDIRDTRTTSTAFIRIFRRFEVQFGVITKSVTAAKLTIRYYSVFTRQIGILKANK